MLYNSPPETQLYVETPLALQSTQSSTVPGAVGTVGSVAVSVISPCR